MKLPKITAKNKLTGADYVLFDFSDNTKRGNELRLQFEYEEFQFSIDKNVRFTDNEGKNRSYEYQDNDLLEFCQNIVQLHRQESGEIINFTHDIQYLVGTLVHNSIVRNHQKDNIKVLQAKLDKINLISIIISAKNTYFRYLTEDIDFLKPSDVDISGKTFKVAKSIPFLAEASHKKIRYTFNTNGTENFIKKMINVYDFIPFQLIENAIKYCPMEDDFEINLHADRNEICFHMESMGPVLLEGESQLIFEKGYRGVNAKKMETAGHGLGLAQTKKALIELTGGNINVDQKGAVIEINGIPFQSTTFTVRIPKH